MLSIIYLVHFVLFVDFVIQKCYSCNINNKWRCLYGKYHDVVRFVGGSRFTVWGREWDEYLDNYLFKNKEEAEQALARMEDNNGKPSFRNCEIPNCFGRKEYIKYG